MWNSSLSAAEISPLTLSALCSLQPPKEPTTALPAPLPLLAYIASSVRYRTRPNGLLPSAVPPLAGSAAKVCRPAQAFDRSRPPAARAMRRAPRRPGGVGDADAWFRERGSGGCCARSHSLVTLPRLRRLSSRIRRAIWSYTSVMYSSRRCHRSRSSRRPRRAHGCSYRACLPRSS